MAPEPDRGSPSDGQTTPVAHRGAVRRRIVREAVRPVVVTLTMIAAYFTLPWDQPVGAIGLAFVVGLAVVTWLLVRQTRRIRNSPLPVLRGVEIAATAVTGFLLLFSGAYFVTEQAQVRSFSEPLTRLDAIYLVLTIFTTLGFGDIVPVTDGARILVILQMLGDLVFYGVVVRVVVQAVRTAQKLPSSGVDD